ncbi:TetR family transcriptional regulator [Amycolatopsis nigrescens]|uniref:TetR/AcrR family transcriptional regulator n=1 Tax=Amycolatopsis nigrescens TaxID=381445 RepID=UPI00037FDECC|nr:TetR family transcriptional regulator [Amycolatopsis nigrescens]
MARAGRRPGQTETREHILAAARKLFAQQGYGGATVRAIATEAGVNPAMLNHFYGTKQQLFVAAMELPFNPAELIPAILEGPREHAGERLVRAFLDLWREPAGRAPFLALLRSVTTNEEAAAMMRTFMDQVVFSKVADGFGIPRVRMTAAAAQLIGVALLRYIVAVPPIAEVPEEEIVQLVAPAIQHYIDG